jgi:flagellar biosynthesis/type III secretory pathway M-ring protein FliF/YscJ
MADAVIGLPPAMAERVLSSVSFVKLGGDRLGQFGVAGERLVAAAQQSFVDAASAAFLVAAIGLLAGAVVAAVRAPRRQEPAASAADEQEPRVKVTR